MRENLYQMAAAQPIVDREVDIDTLVLQQETSSADIAAKVSVQHFEMQNRDSQRGCQSI